VLRHATSLGRGRRDHGGECQAGRRPLALNAGQFELATHRRHQRLGNGKAHAAPRPAGGFHPVEALKDVRQVLFAERAKVTSMPGKAIILPRWL
jgi:hypothetical protein